MQKVFQLGRLVITNQAAEVLNPNDIPVAIKRHENCDWGEVCQEDKDANNAALHNGERILSVYHASNGQKFWIITEADRSVTTLLLPEDY